MDEPAARTIPDCLIGRDAEAAVVFDVIDDSVGQGRSLLIEGDAGLGKTALLGMASDHAKRSDFQVLRCTGLQASAPLGFAGLHELLHPLLHLVDALPPRQRSALLTAFALDEGTAPERLLVGLGALSLLEEASTHTPIFIAIDDLQWMDHSTVHVLNFIALRLSTSPIAMIASVRPGVDADALPQVVLPSLVLEPLSDSSARALLADVGSDLRPASRERILHDAAGNPLALRELPAALRRHGITLTALQQNLPTTKKLERAFLDQLEPVPLRSRTLLTLIAASDGAPVTDVMKAARLLGIGLDDFGPLEDRGLITLTAGEIHMRHPLLRSAVQSSASTGSWIAAHLALADATVGQDRAVWHRAAASMEQDEDVADQLTEVAARARDRGALPEATTAFRRAATLSGIAERRGQRLASAAETARQAGMTAEAMELLEQVATLPVPAATLAQAAVTRSILSLTAGTPAPTRTELDAVLSELEVPEDAQHRTTVLWCSAVVARAQSLPGSEWDYLRLQLDLLPGRSPLKSAALAVLTPHGAERDAREQLSALAHDLEGFPLGLVSVAIAAESLQDLDTAEAAWAMSLKGFHDSGSAADEVQALRGRAGVLLLRGRLREALASAEYAERLAGDTGQSTMGVFAVAAQARAFAVMGDTTQAQAALDRGKQMMSGASLGMVAADSRWAAGLIAMEQRRFRDALIEFTHVGVHPTRALWTIADRTEAAVRAERADVVIENVDEASVIAERLGSAYLVSLVERSRGLLAGDGDEAEEHFLAAITHGQQADADLDVARTQVLYGGWLRRRRRPVDARSQLAEALTSLDGMGARSLAEMAASELRAAGEVPRRSAGDPSVHERLTPQEFQVARLASEGLSNKEIADRIYLSHRTVSTHLYKAFPKLGITTRSQLASALSTGGYDETDESFVRVS